MFSKLISFDVYLFVPLLILSFLGLLNFFSTSLYYSLIKTGDQFAYFYDFLIKNFILGWIVFFLGHILGNNFHKNRVFFFIAFIVFFSFLWLVILTPLGVEINNAKRWIKLGFFVFQPAELIKPFAILVLVFLLSSNPLASTRFLIFVSLIFIFLIIIPIFFEPAGTNSLIIFLSLIATSLIFFKKQAYLFKYFSIIILIGLFFVFLGIYLWPYRQERILSFFTGGAVFKEKIFQLEKSQIAISSGGFWGKGLGKSEAKYLPLPKMLNDSVFSIYAEEFGFVGSIFLLSLYGFLFLRILKIGFDNPSIEKRAFCLGVFTWLITQTSFHIFSNLGLFVPTGVVLPFFSSGASSQLAIYFSLGLINSFRK